MEYRYNIAAKCPDCKSRCTERHGFYRWENCGYCFTLKPEGSVKITVSPIHDVLPNWIFYFLLRRWFFPYWWKKDFLSVFPFPEYSCTKLSILQFHFTICGITVTLSAGTLLCVKKTMRYGSLYCRQPFTFYLSGLSYMRWWSRNANTGRKTVESLLNSLAPPAFSCR